MTTEQIFQAKVSIPLRGLECPSGLVLHAFSKPCLNAQLHVMTRVLKLADLHSKPIPSVFQARSLNSFSKPASDAIPRLVFFRVNTKEPCRDQ